MKKSLFKTKNLTLATLSTAFLVSTLSANAAVNKSFIKAEFVPAQVLVKLKPGTLSKFLAKTNSLKNNGLNIKEQMSLGFGDVLVMESNNKSMQTMMLDLQNDPMVDYVEPNFIYKAINTDASSVVSSEVESDFYSSFTPNDPKFGDLWGLNNSGNNEPGNPSSSTGVAGADVNALAAWSITRGSRNVKIAVIDTGVDYTHPDLINNMWTNTAEKNGLAGVDDDGNGYVDDIHGYDFANNDGDPMDGHMHGTHCAGTIAAEHNNGIGVAGVMGEAQIVAIKFLTDEGSGSTESAIKSIDYATKLNVDIMSNSWGGGGSSQLLKDAIQNASDAGIVFTAAAGNSASDNDVSPHYPSNYDVPNVISVAAHNYNDGLASFSCYGSDTVHVSAPGRNILSTKPNAGYATISGTSMATPHVSGVVGLYIAEHGRIDVEELRNKLMESSNYSRAYGKTTISRGRVDAYNFLTGVVASRPSTPNPNAWVTQQVTPYESSHPYVSRSNVSKTFTVPGAKFVRILITKYELESSYDSLKILDANGAVVETIDGSGLSHYTEYVEGDSITLKFSSDEDVNKWGFLVEEVQYIQ